MRLKVSFWAILWHFGAFLAPKESQGSQRGLFSKIRECFLLPHFMLNLHAKFQKNTMVARWEKLTRTHARTRVNSKSGDKQAACAWSHLCVLVIRFKSLAFFLPSYILPSTHTVTHELLHFINHLGHLADKKYILVHVYHFWCVVLEEIARVYCVKPLFLAQTGSLVKRN